MKAEHTKAAARTPPASAPERRQLTVMFCDMVGSSALSTRLDPEEQRDLVANFQSCCAGEIKRFGGMVAQYLGDGVLAYFGYPAAHEDDAERAVRAGLLILRQLGAAKSIQGTMLQARLGIATGVVVVGDLVREGVTQENAAIGETTNLAARLQSLAEPGALLICPVTHRLVGMLFEYRDLDRHTLKGFARPVHVRQVTGASGIENRFEARRAYVASPLLGRDEELELLLRRWEQVKRGEGRVVLLTGEAGIGKSRLTRALQDRLRAEPHTPLIYHCSPYHQDSALHPIIGQLTHAAAIDPKDTSEARLEKLEALLAQSSGNPADEIPLFAALLSIPGSDRHQLPKFAPHRLKELTLRALIGQLVRLAAPQPVLMIFEDLHWVDPTTLELLSLAVGAIKSSRVLIIATTRPEFTAPWPSHRHITTVPLSRLDRTEGEAIVAGVTKGKRLPAEVLEQIVERTDGVPLFIEELTKTVLESGLLREGETGYELIASLPPLGIPSSLHASLLARLDRLSSIKDVAQICATIGREFSYELVAAVAALPAKDLNVALAQLVDAELIFQRGVPPDAHYTFKHALVQDAAYSSLVRSRRHQLHGAIARALESRFSSVVANEPATLAHHCTEAGLLDQAISYWSAAGELSLDRSAMVEAALQLNKALSLLSSLPAPADQAERELNLLTKLGVALTATKGYAAPETGLAYARARTLCTELGDANTLLRVGYGEFLYHLMRGEISKSHDVATEILSLAEQTGNQDARVLGHRTLGVSLFEFGKLASARRELEMASKLEGDRGQIGSAMRGRDARIMIATWLANILLLQGHIDQAKILREGTLDPSTSQTALHSRGYVMGFAAYGAWLLQDYKEVVRIADELYELSDQLGFRYAKATAALYKGYGRLASGESAAEQYVREGLDEMRQSQSKWALPFWLGTYASLLQNRMDEAEALLQQAFEAVELLDERWHEPELHRLRGDFALRYNQPDEVKAEQSYASAKRLAEHQGSKLLELRSAESLARLWDKQGRRHDAHIMLNSVYRCFVEGLDTPQLQNVSRVLTDLSK